jgi:hypothetical protein
MAGNSYGMNQDWIDSGAVATSVPGGLRMFALSAVLTVGSEPIAGDYNSDGVVDTRDYIVWRKNLGHAVTPGTNGDANGNGVVENSEYQPWRANYGRTLGSGLGSGLTAVPEPASISFAIVLFAYISATGAVARRRLTSTRLKSSNQE